MQSSHRNLLAVSIGAIVLMGSTEASLAEAISTSSLEFAKPSKVDDDESDRPLFSSEPLSIADSIADSIAGSIAGSTEAIAALQTDEFPIETGFVLAESSGDRSIAYSSEPFQTADIVAILESAKVSEEFKPNLDETEQNEFSQNEFSQEETLESRETLAPITLLEQAPSLDHGAELERPEPELLSQTSETAPSEPEGQDEADSQEVEVIDTEIEPDVLESQDPNAEVEIEPELDAEADSDAQVDPEAQVDPDVELEEGTIDAIPVIEDVPEDVPTSNSAEDLEIPTEAIPVISAPDYLDANPNDLYFPTDPEEIAVMGNQPITLAQALELARRNSRELQSARLNVDRAGAALDEALAQRFPQLTAGANLTHSDVNPAQDTVEQTNPFTGEVSDVEIDSDNNTTTFSANVQLAYDLFTSGQRAASIQAARRNLRQLELQVEVVLEDIRLSITNAYYDVQETDESVRIAQSSLEESLESLRIAEARERAGVGTRFDRLQAEVDAANSQQDLRSARSNQQIARRQLAQILSIPTGVNISAADEVNVAGNWLLSLEESLVLAFKNRAEPEQLLVQREIDDLQRRAELGAYGPQLSVFGRYRMQDLLDETRGRGDSEAFEVGLQLDLLLFDGGGARARARQEAVDIEIAESDFADTLEEIRFDVEQSFFQLGSNFENIRTASTAVTLAEESLRLARLRFSAGVGIQSDVITAQADLTEAEFNVVSAILDYNRALVAMQRAVSNLDGNNLSDVP